MAFEQEYKKSIGEKITEGINNAQGAVGVFKGIVDWKQQRELTQVQMEQAKSQLEEIQQIKQIRQANFEEQTNQLIFGKTLTAAQSEDVDAFVTLNEDTLQRGYTARGRTWDRRKYVEQVKAVQKLAKPLIQQFNQLEGTPLDRLNDDDLAKFRTNFNKTTQELQNYIPKDQLPMLAKRNEGMNAQIDKILDSRRGVVEYGMKQSLTPDKPKNLDSNAPPTVGAKKLSQQADKIAESVKLERESLDLNRRAYNLANKVSTGKVKGKLLPLTAYFKEDAQLMEHIMGKMEVNAIMKYMKDSGGIRGADTPEEQAMIRRSIASGQLSPALLKTVLLMQREQHERAIEEGTGSLKSFKGSPEEVLDYALNADTRRRRPAYYNKNTDEMVFLEPGQKPAEGFQKIDDIVQGFRKEDNFGLDEMKKSPSATQKTQQIGQDYAAGMSGAAGGAITNEQLSGIFDELEKE